MEKQFSTLYNVPKLISTESMSSWITRLSLSQGISPSTLLDYLEIDSSKDLDYHAGKLNLQHLYRKTGVKKFHFTGVKSIYSSLAFLGRKGKFFYYFQVIKLAIASVQYV